MYKTVIVPIVAVFAMAAQLVFGVKIPESLVSDVTQVISNAILVFVTIYGIFKNHRKETSGSMFDDLEQK